MPGLPYLNGIKAFEAAARGGGFTAAARELHVTPAAVSRMVRLLEQRLGLTLFERRPNGLALTPAGIAYQSGLTPIFAALTQLTEQIVSVSGARVLTVGVGPTFAIRWLVPRLSALRRAGRARRGPAPSPPRPSPACPPTLPPRPPSPPPP